MKKIIFGIAIGVILCCGVVYAASLYKSEDVSYTKDGWEVDNVSEALDSLYDSTKNGDFAPLNFKSNATYSTVNITSGSMVCSGNILELQLPTEYTELTINSSKNCEITLTDGLLVIKATGTGSAYVAGNGNRGGPSINFSYDITVSAT